nr:response regulator [Synergistaceae bacterium]
FTIKVIEGHLASQSKLMANKDDVHILVVDDSPEIRTYFVHVMAALELSCDVAQSGSEAISMIENSKGKKPYNIFFIDWQMPEMNGIELIRKIKEITDNNGIIIMISAAEWSDIEKEALAVGVNSFVSKPLLPSTLINRINECLGYKDALALRNQPTQKNYNFKNHTLLIAEDVDVNREIIGAVLENTGVYIDYAEDGLEAVALFSENPTKYSLILMDIHMPKMDGYDATRKIRSLDCPEALSIPIIAMTANVFREDIESCMEAGMNEHIGKPIDTQLLFKKLAYYLQPKGPQLQKTEKINNQSIALEPEYADFLPAIDVLDGLGRVMSNKKLYLTLIKNFLSAGMANELIRSIKDGDSIKTQRTAHALKGVSANLGFIEVNTLVSRIEAEAKMAIDSTENIAGLEIAIDHLNRLIKKLLEGHLIE